MNRCTSAVLITALLISACSTPVRRSSPPTKPSPVTPAASPPKTLAAVPGRPAPELRFQNALALMQDQRPQDAQIALQSLLKDYPDLSGVWTDAGIIQARAKQRDQALKSFERAIAANPSNTVALNWCGAQYREAGDYKRAEQRWQKAIELRPDYAAAVLNLAILYDVSMRRPQDALPLYRRYQELSGNQDLIVSAWVRDLESRGPVVADSGSGAAR